MSAQPPVLSVVVCERNARSRLKETLISLRHQSLPSEHYEVLVVDNASDDGTDRWLEKNQKELAFRLIHAPRLGLSYARNSGTEAARGRFVYFIDDDAIAPAHLLETLLRAAKKSGAAVVGGPVHGLWGVRPPEWLTVRRWAGLSLLSHGDRPRYLKFPEIVIGTNMLYRKESLEAIGGFDPELGRLGDRLVGDEERELQRRLADRGERVFYHPAAYVFHKAPADRLTLDYFSRRIADSVADGRKHYLASPWGEAKAVVHAWIRAAGLAWRVGKADSEMQRRAARRVREGNRSG